MPPFLSFHHSFNTSLEMASANHTALGKFPAPCCHEGIPQTMLTSSGAHSFQAFHIHIRRAFTSDSPSVDPLQATLVLVLAVIILPALCLCAVRRYAQQKDRREREFHEAAAIQRLERQRSIQRLEQGHPNETLPPYGPRPPPYTLKDYQGSLDGDSETLKLAHPPPVVTCGRPRLAPHSRDMFIVRTCTSFCS